MEAECQQAETNKMLVWNTLGIGLIIGLAFGCLVMALYFLIHRYNARRNATMAQNKASVPQREPRGHQDVYSFSNALQSLNKNICMKKVNKTSPQAGSHETDCSTYMDIDTDHDEPEPVYEVVHEYDYITPFRVQQLNLASQQSEGGYLDMKVASTSQRPQRGQP